MIHAWRLYSLFLVMLFAYIEYYEPNSVIQYENQKDGHNHSYGDVSSTCFSCKHINSKSADIGHRSHRNLYTCTSMASYSPERLQGLLSDTSDLCPMTLTSPYNKASAAT